METGAVRGAREPTRLFFNGNDEPTRFATGNIESCQFHGSTNFRNKSEMRINRHYTTAGESPFANVPMRKATSEIKNPDGSVVFKLEDILVPEQFSQVASDIIAQKYFRKAGVPAALKKVEENSVPSFLRAFKARRFPMTGESSLPFSLKRLSI